MNAGKLTDRVVLQRATEVRDSFGEPIQTWTELARVWARVDWEGGSEQSQAAREYAQVPVRVEVRRSTDTMSLREKDRVLVPAGATKLRTVLGTSTTTSLVVDKPGVFGPDDEFCVRIEGELVTVASGAGTSASPYVVTRGAFGSTAKKHTAGVSVIHMVPLDIEGVARTRSTMILTAVRGEVRV